MTCIDFYNKIKKVKDYCKKCTPVKNMNGMTKIMLICNKPFNKLIFFSTIHFCPDLNLYNYGRPIYRVEDIYETCIYLKNLF